MKKNRLIILSILLLGMLSLLQGCNTVEGMGEDIEKGGQHLQDAAD